MNGQWKFSVERQIWSDSIGIRIGFRDGDRFDVAEPLVMRRAEPGAISPPCVSLPFADAQTLMDQMWDAGLRPSQSVGTAGQVEAIKYHLEDMRRLAFGSVP